MAELSPQQDSTTSPPHELESPGETRQPLSAGTKKALGALALVALLMGAACYVISLYNTLQANDEQVEAQWSETLNQYMRRADLIPNVVAVVKSYAGHETALFAEIAHARLGISALSVAAVNSRDPRVFAQFQAAQQGLSAPLSRLLAVAESYPELKSNELYRDLLIQLEGSENRISYARLRYIDTVARYNLGIRRFPGNLLAHSAGMQLRPNFSVDNAQAIKLPPKVDLR